MTVQLRKIFLILLSLIIISATELQLQHFKVNLQGKKPTPKKEFINNLRKKLQTAMRLPAIRSWRIELRNGRTIRKYKETFRPTENEQPFEMTPTFWIDFQGQNVQSLKLFLEEEELSIAREKYYEMKQTCDICYRSVNEKGVEMCILPCFPLHAYCKKCISKFQNNCPTCRRKFGKALQKLQKNSKLKRALLVMLNITHSLVKFTLKLTGLDDCWGQICLDDLWESVDEFVLLGFLWIIWMIGPYVYSSVCNFLFSRINSLIDFNTIHILEYILWWLILTAVASIAKNILKHDNAPHICTYQCTLKSLATVITKSQFFIVLFGGKIWYPYFRHTTEYHVMGLKPPRNYDYWLTLGSISTQSVAFNVLTAVSVASLFHRVNRKCALFISWTVIIVTFIFYFRHNVIDGSFYGSTASQFTGLSDQELPDHWSFKHLSFWEHRDDKEWSQVNQPGKFFNQFYKFLNQFSISQVGFITYWDTFVLLGSNIAQHLFGQTNFGWAIFFGMWILPVRAVDFSSTHRGIIPFVIIWILSAFYIMEALTCNILIAIDVLDLSVALIGFLYFLILLYKYETFNL